MYFRFNSSVMEIDKVPESISEHTPDPTLTGTCFLYQAVPWRRFSLFMQSRLSWKGSLDEPCSPQPCLALCSNLKGLKI